MAQIPVRMNTQGMAFPLLSRQQGRTVIDGSGDLTYVPGVSADGEGPEDRGVPGILYAHNVMPSTYGWQSVGYEEIYRGIPDASKFLQIKFIQGATVPDEEGLPAASRLRTYFARGKNLDGQNRLYYIDSQNVWRPVFNAPAFSGDDDFSVAYVNGYTYILIPKVGIYIFDVALGQLVERDLGGINIETIEGVFAANGYLLLWTSRRVVWSASNNVEDFVPSEITGAGGGAVQEAKGSIVYCIGASLGFIVFTDVNAVSGVYTANEEFPFEFKEIPAAGGIDDPRFVSEESAAGYYYAFTTNGIQRIAHTQSNSVLPNISDFIGNGIFEDFDEITGALVEERLDHELAKRISVIANRYIIISYGKEEGEIFTHAIVVDAVLNRLGKVKIPHYVCFELRSLEAGAALDSRSTLAFLGSSGFVHRVKYQLGCSQTQGIMLYGKLEVTRGRFASIQGVELDSVCPSNNFNVIDLVSYDGKSFAGGVDGYLNPRDEGKINKEFFFSTSGLSHTLLCIGAFDINSMVVTVTINGTM